MAKNRRGRDNLRATIKATVSDLVLIAIQDGDVTIDEIVGWFRAEIEAGVK